MNSRLRRLSVADGDVPARALFHMLADAVYDETSSRHFDQFNHSGSLEVYYCLHGIFQHGHRNSQVMAGACFCDETEFPGSCVRVKKLDTAVYGLIRFSRGRVFRSIVKQ